MEQRGRRRRGHVSEGEDGLELEFMIGGTNLFWNCMENKLRIRRSSLCYCNGGTVVNNQWCSRGEWEGGRKAVAAAAALANSIDHPFPYFASSSPPPIEQLQKPWATFSPTRLLFLPYLGLSFFYKSIIGEWRRTRIFDGDAES
jgi:hypothetical protein